MREAMVFLEFRRKGNRIDFDSSVVWDGIRSGCGVSAAWGGAGRCPSPHRCGILGRI
ncbi:hypothetical protein GCM10027590_48210 [Nocardiopsis nanhaiensis]